MGIYAGTFSGNTATPAAAGRNASALQYGGAAAGAIGAVGGALAQRTALQTAADVGRINARLAEMGAQQELARGNEAAATVSARAGQIKSKQRTAMAANGIDLGEGSAAEVLTSTDMAKEEDMITINQNAVRAAWGLRTQATNYTNEANAKSAGADSISPFMAGTSSLLGSSAQIASSWYMMNKSGVAPKGT